MRLVRLAFAIGALWVVAAALGQPYVRGEVLVKFRPGATRSSLSLHRLGARVVQRLHGIGVECVRISSGTSVERAVALLRSDPGVLYAEPNFIVRLHDVDDPLYSRQWNLRKIMAPAAWTISTGSPSVLVAVLDTGADLGHPDLAGQIAASRNFVGFGPATDAIGHGTHDAGTVAAKTDDLLAIASLGYQTRLLIGKVVADNGQGDLATIAQGVLWAADRGARVITMSLGVNVFSQTLKDAVDSAWSRGIVLVASAGNNNNSVPVYPAAYDHCIAVAATDEKDRRCIFSNYGNWVHVAAPGQSILGLFKNGGTATLSGTSMAAPHVAALAALMWANGARSNQSIRTAIENSGDPAFGFGLYPVGRINARRALLRLP